MDNKLSTFDDWLTKKIEEEAMPKDLTNSGKTFADVLAKNVNVKEVPDGSNHGKDVDRYIKTAGLDPNRSGKALPNTGYPWCMAFVYTMFDDFTNKMGIKNPLVKTAGVLDHWKSADPHLKIQISDIKRDPSMMKPGQIFIQDHGGGKGHTGIVVSVNAKNRSFTTIEGNGVERNTATREGDKVVRNTRQMNQSNLVGVIDYFKGSRTEEFEQTISKEVAGVASSYTPDTTNGGHTTPTTSSTTPSGLKRKYYKVYDKENRRFLTAKYKGSSFKVYNRRRKLVGEVFKKGESVFMDSVDITSTPVGIVFVKLFKYAAQNKTLPNNNKSGADYLTINSSGKIKHNYSGAQANNIALIEKAATKHGITNPNSLIGILSVIGKESQFIPKSEKMVYSVGRLPEVWGKFSKTGKRVPKGQGKNNYNDLASQYAGNDQKLANFVYGGKYGNGPESSGDGYKYRGRGFNQITFKGTYEKYSRLLGKDLVNNPDLLNDPGTAGEAAVLFLLNRFKEKGYDPNSTTSVDDAIAKFAGANAGWGNSPSNAIANANKIKPNFSIA